MSDSKLAIILMAALCALLLFFDKADAATLQTKSETTVHLYGQIEEGDAKRLSKYLEANPGVTTLTLDSEGGNAIEGYRLGYTIRHHDLRTVVGYEKKCLSACATAFVGGTSHIISGVLAMHVSWLPNELETNEALKQGQYLGMIEAGYMFDMGYTNQLGVIVAQVTSPDTFFVLKSVSDLEMFKIVDGFNDYVELPKGWVSERIAGPLRLHLLMRGI